MNAFWQVRVYFLALIFLMPALAIASDSDGIREDIENNPVCRSVNYFIVGAAATHLGRGAQSAIVAGAALAGVGLGADSIQRRCERELEDFVRYYEENPVDYDDFVENHCGGNPFNCPGGWSANPASCRTFINCAPFIIDISAPGVSISNVIGAIHHIDLANHWGSWDGPRYDPDPPPFFDPK